VRKDIERVRKFMRRHHPEALDSNLSAQVDEGVDSALRRYAAGFISHAQALIVHARTKSGEGDHRTLRAQLMIEELAESVLALAKRDVRGLADALGDLIYVTIGTALTYGIPIEAVFREIHRSNMTKVVSGDVRVQNEGDDYSPPDLERVLREKGGEA